MYAVTCVIWHEQYVSHPMNKFSTRWPSDCTKWNKKLQIGPQPNGLSCHYSVTHNTVNKPALYTCSLHCYFCRTTWFSLSEYIWGQHHHKWRKNNICDSPLCDMILVLFFVLLLSCDLAYFTTQWTSLLIALTAFSFQKCLILPYSHWVQLSITLLSVLVPASHKPAMYQFSVDHYDSVVGCSIAQL